LHTHLLTLSTLQAEIWSLDIVTKEYGCGPLSAENVDSGLIQINSHTQVSIAIDNSSPLRYEPVKRKKRNQ